MGLGLQPVGNNGQLPDWNRLNSQVQRRSIVSKPKGAMGPQFGRGRPQQLLGQADQAGLFNPYGPPSSFFDPIRAEQTAGSQARQKQLLTASSLFGRGDPSQRGYAAIHGLMGEQGNLARILGAARAQQQQQQLQFFQDLMKDFAASGNRGAFAGR